MKFFVYSQIIGKLENLDERTQYILEITALMHDIGIKKSEENMVVVQDIVIKKLSIIRKRTFLKQKKEYNF